MQHVYWFVKFAIDRFAREWKVVPREVARQNAYFGMRGWLLLIYLVTVGGILVTTIELILPVDPDLLQQVHGDSVFHMRATEILGLAAFAPFVLLATLKHPLTPKALIAGMWGTTILGILIEMIAWPNRHDKIALSAIIGAAISALMTWYALSSRRVNVTFLNRVPADLTTTAEWTTYSEDRSKRNRRIFWAVVGTLGGIHVLALIAWLIG